MSLAVFSIIMVELLIIAVIDLRTKKISNLWSIFNLVLTICLYFFMPDKYQWNWEVLLFPIGFLIIGFFLFLMNVMGAGDSKFLVSLFLVLPLEYHLPFFEKLLLSTIFIGSILLSIKLVKNFSTIKAYLVSRHWAGLRGIIQSRFSYAPVIFISWILLGVSVWK